MRKIRLPPEITPLLLRWYQGNARDLPWRKNRDPYGVWISEIMLQQTRVDTVIPYYQRFLLEIPSLERLADMEEERLLKLWEGLGYYTRARNLQKTAKIIMTQHGGVFPKTASVLRALPGIGAYTAGAIASISFDQPEPAVDGNVLRVVSRWTRTAEADDPVTKQEIAEAVKALYPDSARGDFTQALMELGAVVCLPSGLPRCEVCPVSALCEAKKKDEVTLYPQKKKKLRRAVEEWTVLILEHKNVLAIEQRPQLGLLSGLWQLPCERGLLEKEEALSLMCAQGAAPHAIGEPALQKHVFTHIEWKMRVYKIACGKRIGRYTWVTPEELAGNYALPAAFKKCLPM